MPALLSQPVCRTVRLSSIYPASLPGPITLHLCDWFGLRSIARAGREWSGSTKQFDAGGGGAGFVSGLCDSLARVLRVFLDERIPEIPLGLDNRQLLIASSINSELRGSGEKRSHLEIPWSA